MSASVRRQFLQTILLLLGCDSRDYFVSVGLFGPIRLQQFRKFDRVHHIGLRCQLDHLVQLSLFLFFNLLILHLQTKPGSLAFLLTAATFLLRVFRVHSLELVNDFLFELWHFIEARDAVPHLRLKFEIVFVRLARFGP